MCRTAALPSAAPQQQSQAKAPYTIKAANGVYDMTAASRKQVFDLFMLGILSIRNAVGGPSAL